MEGIAGMFGIILLVYIMQVNNTSISAPPPIVFFVVWIGRALSTCLLTVPKSNLYGAIWAMFYAPILSLVK